VVIPEINTFLWDQWFLPLAVKKQDTDLFYSPYYKIPLFKPCRTVSAILDLMYLAYVPYYKKMSPLAKLYYATFGKFYALCADKILTCSQHSQKDIERIYGVSGSKIKTIALSIAPIYFEPQDPSKITAIKIKFNINGRYILYLGNFKAHKNIALLIHAFAAIAQEFPDVNLVLAGPKEHTYTELTNIIHDKGLAERVVFTGKIIDSDGPQYLYQGAEIFVMPSLYEGFGIPPIEAMACGVPVIASRTSSIPEIVADAGILVEPNNAAEISKAIRTIFKDPALKKEFINKGLKRAHDYESEKIAQEMYDFLKTVPER
jgi:glycosyltransferase involved in cell wall biosynthesis